MSTIKVDTIQSRQHSTSTINLTSTGATVNGDCTATTFSGSGASLTALPAANLTGTLPAIDGSNLTGLAGGGAYDFVSKTTVSTSVAQIDFNPTGGFSAGQYKLIGKSVLISHYDGNIEIAPFLNGGTSISYSGWRYILEKYGNYQGYAGAMSQYVNYNRVTMDHNSQTYIDSSSNNGFRTFEMDFSTDYKSYFKINTFGTGNQQEYCQIWGHLSNSQFPYATNKVTGLRFTLENSRTYEAGSEFILFKLKES